MNVVLTDEEREMLQRVEAKQLTTDRDAIVARALRMRCAVVLFVPAFDQAAQRLYIDTARGRWYPRGEPAHVRRLALLAELAGRWVPVGPADDLPAIRAGMKRAVRAAAKVDPRLARAFAIARNESAAARDRFEPGICFSTKLGAGATWARLRVQEFDIRVT